MVMGQEGTKKQGAFGSRPRQVAGKTLRDWGGDTYHGDAMTRRPPSAKRKLSSQDCNGQPGETRIAQRVPIDHAESQLGTWRAPSNQEGVKEPRGR